MNLTISRNKKIISAVLISLFANSAFAAVSIGTSSLCDIASSLKSIGGVVALIAIALLVINSFFGKSEVIADIVTKVLVGAGILAVSSALVTSTGLTNACSSASILTDAIKGIAT